MEENRRIAIQAVIRKLRAEELIRRGNLAEAEDLLREAVTGIRQTTCDGLTKVEIKYQLAKVLRKRGEYREALELLEECVPFRDPLLDEAFGGAFMHEEMAKVYEALGNRTRVLQQRSPLLRICANEDCPARHTTDMTEEGYQCFQCECAFYCSCECMETDWNSRHRDLCERVKIRTMLSLTQAMKLMDQGNMEDNRTWGNTSEDCDSLTDYMFRSEQLLDIGYAEFCMWYSKKTRNSGSSALFFTPDHPQEQTHKLYRLQNPRKVGVVGPAIPDIRSLDNPENEEAYYRQVLCTYAPFRHPRQLIQPEQEVLRARDAFDMWFSLLNPLQQIQLDMAVYRQQTLRQHHIANQVHLEGGNRETN